MGALASLAGSWEGEGLQVGFTAGALDATPREAVLLATRETLTFAEIEIAGAESEESGLEAQMPGLYFLRRSNDRYGARRIQGESGTWLSISDDTDPPDPYGVLCLSGTLTEDTLPAMGQAQTLSRLAGPPAVSARARGDLDALPGGLRALAVSLERLPLPKGVGAAEVDDPHALLRRQPGSERSHETLHLGVSSDAAAELAAALSQSGRFVAQREHAKLEIDLWLQHERGAGSTLLLSRRLLRMHHGVFWPHITVAALRPSTNAGPGRGAVRSQIAGADRPHGRSRPTGARRPR